MNATFVDEAGRTWALRIDVNVMRRLRANGFDISDAPAFLARLAEDPVALVDALCIVCDGQHSISSEEFGRAMAGDVIEHAVEAFVGALVNFTPSQKGRENLIALWEMAKRQAGKLETTIRTTVIPRIEKEVETELAKAVGSSSESSTSAPESSGAIPAR